MISALNQCGCVQLDICIVSNAHAKYGGLLRSTLVTFVLLDL